MNKSDIMKAAEILRICEEDRRTRGDDVFEYYENQKSLLDYLNSFLAAAELLKQVEWQPIESAPKTGEVIILYGQTQHAEFPFVGQGHWYKVYKKWAWHHYIGDEPKQPTHFMPLPTPPVIIDKEGV